ncbi:MAG TPA: aminotransferase [Peptococcaceae bacterium]|nr:aminotransferase [Peptococcaceae bacterium]
MASTNQNFLSDRLPWKKEKKAEPMGVTNTSESSPLLGQRQMETAFETFRRMYPDYDSTRKLDELRATEYARLDRGKHVYLDYTSASLYAQSQLQNHMALLSEEVLGNPGSKNITSLKMSQMIEHVREYTLQYFNASSDEYMVIFTQNATAALKLIGESYPFKPGATFLLTCDNHNSVNGIREYAHDQGAAVDYVPILPPHLYADEDYLTKALQSAKTGENHLFAYPAQSNFSGVQYPLNWIEEAQEKGWDVLLDAAAYVPTNRLDLGRWHPDFVTVSFYKIFGYPTGIGCLLMRKSAAKKLRRPWFAAGTTVFSSVAASDHYQKPGPAGYEDGTVNYLSFPAVEFGLKWIESIGIDMIHTRVMCLTDWLIDQLLLLYHRNGQPLIRLYGPPDAQRRGANIQVNFFSSAGMMIDCYIMEKLANEERISLQAGCQCNPGAREAALGVKGEDLTACFQDKASKTYDQFMNGLDGKMTGAVRASLGVASNFSDVYRYVQFARSFIDFKS